MSTFTIISFDPGGTTGWATFQCTWMPAVDGPNEIYNPEFNCGQLGPEEHHRAVWDLLGINHTDKYHIVTESFEYRNDSRPGLNLISREYIGVMKLFAKQRVVPFSQQMAAVGKVTDISFVRKVNLQRLELWHSGNGHAMDAYGHLLQYMIKNNIYKRELITKGWKT